MTVGKQNVKSKTQIDKTDELKPRKRTHTHKTPTACSHFVRSQWILVVVGCVRFHTHFQRKAMLFFIILNLFFHWCFVLLLLLPLLLIQIEIYK